MTLNLHLLHNLCPVHKKKRLVLIDCIILFGYMRDLDEAKMFEMFANASIAKNISWDVTFPSCADG